MNSPTPPPLEVRGLRKSFRGRARVDDVGFTVRAGHVVGLLGPNGAGKTTTMRLLLGLASPDAGDALVFGRPYRDLQHPPRTVGAVLDGGGLHPSRTGRQHLRMAAARTGVRSDRVGAVLAKVGMTDRADQRTGGYSLGMKQRIAIAEALLGEPSLLVLDEPSNGLDPAGMHWLRKEIRDFAGGGGAVLISSHLLADIRAIADDVVIIVDGRVAAEAPLVDALAGADGDLERFYLGATETTGVR